MEAKKIAEFGLSEYSRHMAIYHLRIAEKNFDAAMEAREVANTVDAFTLGLLDRAKDDSYNIDDYFNRLGEEFSPETNTTLLKLQ